MWMEPAMAEIVEILIEAKKKKCGHLKKFSQHKKIKYSE